MTVISLDGGVSGSSLTSLALANAGNEPSVQEWIFTIVVEHTVPGDGNGDGCVDGLDYLLWAGNFGTHPGADGDISNGDYNDDGWIDGLDYLLWAGNFGSHSATSVPEPGAIYPFLLAGLLALGARRRRWLQSP